MSRVEGATASEDWRTKRSRGCDADNPRPFWAALGDPAALASGPGGADPVSDYGTWKSREGRDIFRVNRKIQMSFS